MQYGSSYNHATIYSNYKVKPWLETKLKVGVAQDLEAECAMVRRMVWGVCVQPRYKAIECVKHDFQPFVNASSNMLMCLRFKVLVMISC